MYIVLYSMHAYILLLHSIYPKRNLPAKNDPLLDLPQVWKGTKHGGLRRQQRTQVNNTQAKSGLFSLVGQLGVL